MGNFIDMTGWNMWEHGVPDSKLTVIEYAGNGMWRVRCSCGNKNTFIKGGGHIRQGHSKSCGCLHKESAIKSGKRRRKTNKYDLSGEYGVGYCSNTNQPFFFDLEDYDKIKDYYWHESISKGYHSVTTTDPSTKKRIGLHYLIGCKGYDHINRNPLDNRKCNLRPATPQQNAANSSVHKNNTSGVTGVCWKTYANKWCAKISYKHDGITLGYYTNKDDAIKARLQAEAKYFGEFAPQKHLFEQYGITPQNAYTGGEKIYLDNASTTKPKRSVIRAINECFNDVWGNPSSIHSLGAEAKEVVNNNRKIVANFIGAKPSEIIFTSGACEANSLAICGLLKQGDYTLITTNIEHKSIMNIADDYLVLRKIGVDENGFVDLNQLEYVVKTTYGKPIVSIQYANNEIGTIQDMREISNIVHRYGGILHTDATQIIPDCKIDVTGIDMMSFSGQKLGAPKGIGVLYVREGIELSPIIYGSQEKSRRGGTENVPYIAGLGEAVRRLEYPTGEVRDYFVQQVLAQIPDCYLVGPTGENRLKNNASICFKGVSSEMMVVMLDQKGICVSSGSACNAGMKVSHVLKAIGIGDDAKSVVRFTFGDNTKAEVDVVVEELVKICKKVRKNS